MSCVLLIGAAGLVGSHLRVALDREELVATYHRVAVPSGHALDVTDTDAVRALIRRVRPDAIVLAAAEPHVERCEREPDATRRVNVEAALTVAEAAREAGARLVILSSEYIFDGRAGPYREGNPVRPINEYGRQKVELEAIARGVPRHLVCRTSGVFGWEPGGKNFALQLVRRLRDGRVFDVPDDQVVTPTYAPDLAAAIAALLRADRNGTFHVAGPQVISRLALGRMVARAFSLDEGLVRGRSTAELGYAAPRPRDAGLCDTKLRSTLGHGLRPPEEALADMRSSEGRSP